MGRKGCSFKEILLSTGIIRIEQQFGETPGNNQPTEETGTARCIREQSNHIGTGIVHAPT